MGRFVWFRFVKLLKLTRCKIMLDSFFCRWSRHVKPGRILSLSRSKAHPAVIPQVLSLPLVQVHPVESAIALLEFLCLQCLLHRWLPPCPCKVYFFVFIIPHSLTLCHLS